MNGPKRKVLNSLAFERRDRRVPFRDSKLVYRYDLKKETKM